MLAGEKKERKREQQGEEKNRKVLLKGTNVATEDIYEGSGLNYNVCEMPPFFSLERVHENKFISFSGLSSV